MVTSQEGRGAHAASKASPWIAWLTICFGKSSEMK